MKKIVRQTGFRRKLKLCISENIKKKKVFCLEDAQGKQVYFIHKLGDNFDFPYVSWHQRECHACGNRCLLIVQMHILISPRKQRPHSLPPLRYLRALAWGPMVDN